MKKRKFPVYPSRLKEGDVVGIISPSSPVLSESNLQKGMEALKSLGLVPKLAPNARAACMNYMAGTPEERLRDFHAMYADKDVRGIFCTGGGFVSQHLLPNIDWNLLKKNPKIFVGYSDITSLLAAIWKKTGSIAFHGPAIEELDITDAHDAFTVAQFKYMLMDGTIGALSRRSTWKILRSGEARGHLLGGNLTVLTGLLGTSYAPDWKGAILFWEETEETVDALDHYLWRLRIAGVFGKISGMIVGKVTNIEPIEDAENEPAHIGKEPSVEEVILSATKGFSFPILSGVDFGHHLANLTLPIGADTYLDCSPPFDQGKISILGHYSEE